MLFDQTGGGGRELTRGKPRPTSLGSYSWSPDGSRIVYASGETLAGGDLYVLGVDDGHVSRVTSDGANEDPAWSPDGRHLAYVHGRRDGEIWLLDVATGERGRLTTDGGIKAEPRWSPNGSRILYFRDESGEQGGTFVIEARSGRRLLHTRDYRAVWSPDGARLAADSGLGIDVFEADGSGRRTVARGRAHEPTWSPDGSRIAFSRSHCTAGVKGLCGDVLRSVYAVSADGRGERRLSGPIGRGPDSRLEGRPFDHSGEPVWWPDGSRLFFRHDDKAHVMNADGTCERPFGSQTLVLWRPAWRPGSSPSLPGLHCVDLRLRAATLRRLYGKRSHPRIDVVVENDGNQTATGVVLTLRAIHGRARIASRSCRGTTVVRCSLAPLPPGASTRLLVGASNRRRVSFRLLANAVAREFDSDKGQNDSEVEVFVSPDCDVVGTWGADRLVGTRRRDTICGLPGSDAIVAGAGNDTITAGAGADTIRPGRGRDTVVAGEGRDRIYARDGQRDRIDCGPYLDTVHADRLDQLVDCEHVLR
jgi:Tol biopolymer transport system component